MNLLSVLHVEKSLQTKKKKFSVFLSQFAAKKEIISTLLAWLSSVCRERNRVLKISTARIDEWNSVPTFAKVITYALLQNGLKYRVLVIVVIFEH